MRCIHKVETSYSTSIIRSHTTPDNHRRTDALSASVLRRLYRYLRAVFEQPEGAWEDRYASSYGFWRPFVMDVIYNYLDCGDLHFGFARVRCEGCGHEYLLPFSKIDIMEGPPPLALRRLGLL